MYRLNYLICGLAAVTLCMPVAWAQEEDPVEQAPPVKMGAIIMSRSGEGGEMEMNVQAIQPMDMAAPMVFSFDSSLGAATFGSFMGGSGIRSNSIDWIQNDDILEELEIVNEQREKLRQLQEEVRQQRNDFNKAFREVPPEKRIDFIRDFSSLLTANVDDKVEDILLPHQLKRYEQLRLQTKLRGSGMNAAYSEEIAKLLGITEEQKEEMRKKQAGVQKELQKKIEQLRKEALDEVLSVLTPTQRKKLESLTGKEYEFKLQTMFPKSLPRPESAEVKKGE